ncbi:MAG: HAMP domain-containing sensor histidine kinase [Gemmataceae bacterium]
MRSIRRSLIGYFMLLLALSLGAMAVLVNRFAEEAIKDREAAEARRIEKAYEVRQQEAKAKFDAEVLSETKSLARELQAKLQAMFGGRPPGGGGPGPGGIIPRPPEAGPRPMGVDPSLQAGVKIDTDPAKGSAEQFRLRLTMLEFAASPWSRVATTYAIEPPLFITRQPGSARNESYRLLTPLWVAYDSIRSMHRIQDAIRELFKDDEHLGLCQLNIRIGNGFLTPPRGAFVVRSPKLEHELPAPAETVERGSDVEYLFEDVESPQGRLRRVVKVGGRPGLWFWAQVPLPAGIAPNRMLPRQGEYVAVTLSHARPYSELEGRLLQEQHNGDAELAKVRDDTQRELATLRARLTAIGLGSFLALVAGGWFIVARGLAPIRKLSDAVSRVSEKDFRLPVEQGDMSREMLPIIAGLRQTLDSLRAAFEREKQAVGDISHELRTPIASMLATLDVALRKPRTAEQYRTTLEDCREIAKQLGGLVERIMSLASLDAGAVRDSIQFIDAANLATECSAVIRPLAEAHGLTFTLRTDRPLELETDADKLREVLMNLLHNAVEYNREGGSVTLTVQRDGPHLAFEVRDTGIGMTPSIREKIFERFFRADPSRHATGVHAGLGLAIVKEYVARLGGTIAVESEPDVGTVFRVLLPAAPPAGEDQPDEPADFAEPALPDFRPRARAAPAGS